MKIRQKYFLLFLLTFFVFPSFAQIQLGEDLEIDYINPRIYEIGGITVSGAQYLDQNVLISLTGLAVGDKIYIPGENITKGIKKLWEQGLFVVIAGLVGVFLVLTLFFFTIVIMQKIAEAAKSGKKQEDSEET